MIVRLSPAARKDIADAARFYEGRRDGLGGEFVDRVDEAIARIELNAAGYAVVFEGLRKCQLRQFTDYALWFAVRGNALVIACVSGRRDRALVRERARRITKISGAKLE